MKKIIGLVGTNSEQSTNRQLLQFMQHYFAQEADIELVEIVDFPMFNKPEDKVLPEIVKTVAEKIEAADGIIISTPEYDHAVPASLMNALSWLSYGIFPFVDKPVMITGASYGTLGSSRAQAHLRQILDAPELKARIMPSSEFLDKLAGLFADFCVFIEITEQLKHAHAQNKKEAENFSWETI